MNGAARIEEECGPGRWRLPCHQPHRPLMETGEKIQPWYQYPAVDSHLCWMVPIEFGKRIGHGDANLKGLRCRLVIATRVTPLAKGAVSAVEIGWRDIAFAGASCQILLNLIHEAENQAQGDKSTRG